MEPNPYESPKTPIKPVKNNAGRTSKWITVFGLVIGGFAGWFVSGAILRDSFESLGPILESLVLIGISSLILLVIATSAWSIGRLIVIRNASLPLNPDQTTEAPKSP